MQHELSLYVYDHPFGKALLLSSSHVVKMLFSISLTVTVEVARGTQVIACYMQINHYRQTIVKQGLVEKKKICIFFILNSTHFIFLSSDPQEVYYHLPSYI